MDNMGPHAPDRFIGPSSTVTPFSRMWHATRASGSSVIESLYMH